MNLARLRRLYEALPEGASVVLTRGDLGELLAGDEMGDHTCETLASQLGRTPACIRSWCSSGKLPGAYKVAGREWRIPAGSVRAFLGRAAAEHGASTPPPSAEAVDLGSWRKHLKESA